MTRTARVAAAAGATPRTEYPPFGNQTSRAEWTDRLVQTAALADALSLLIEWRASRAGNALEEADFLWIESRIEDRVAVLRFAELSTGFIETTTLTGEPIAAVTETALTDARAADDATAIEAIVGSFRRRYKPPIMPTVPFMRTEIELAELLITRRNLGWYDEPLEELRRRRAAVVVD
jgi:methane monooxygenase component A gamma chain